MTDEELQQINAGPSSLASNLGGLLFGGADSGMNEYLSKDQQKQMQSQALMSAAMSLLKNSGYTTQPISLGQALGSAYEAGTAGYQGAQKNAIQQMLTKQKLDEYKMAQQQRRRLEEIFGAQAPTAGMPMTPQQALAVPGGQVGPTAERAAMIGQMPEAAAVSPEDMRYEQFMRAAQLYAASDPGKAEAYQKMAMSIKPREEVTGQPFEVTGADGLPVMVQQFKGGKIKTLEGFGPKREVVLQNVDGRVVAIDKNKLAGGEVYGTGITPAEQKRLEMEAARLGMDVERLKMERQRLGFEARRLNISEQELQRGQYERMENEDGVFYVPKVPGLPAIPVAGPGGVPLKGKAPPKPTEGEANAAGFASQMENSEAIIKALPAGSQPGAGSGIAGSVPFIGDVTKRLVQPEATQRYEQAAQAWIRAKLRKESGAAIGVDEMAQEYRTYFPQINDTPANIKQKAEARRIATEAMKKSAGRSYTPSGGLNWNPATQQWE
jgi:hypothetical protein